MLSDMQESTSALRKEHRKNVSLSITSLATFTIITVLSQTKEKLLIRIFFPLELQTLCYLTAIMKQMDAPLIPVSTLGKELPHI